MIQEILVVTSAYIRLPICTDSWGEGGESQGNPIVGRIMPVFEKEVFLKA